MRKSHLLSIKCERFTNRVKILWSKDSTTSQHFYPLQTTKSSTFPLTARKHWRRIDFSNFVMQAILKKFFQTFSTADTTTNFSPRLEIAVNDCRRSILRPRIQIRFLIETIFTFYYFFLLQRVENVQHRVARARVMLQGYIRITEGN